jgi:hypothetical protein
MAQKPDGKPARPDRVTFTRGAAERIGKAVRKVEGGNRDLSPVAWGPRIEGNSRPFRYFRLTQEMEPCGVASGVRVKPVCCGTDDLRMDLVDLEEPEPPVYLYDHLGSARIYNLISGFRKKQPIPSGTYCLARWVSFANDDSEIECGAGGVWELVGFLPCAAAACGSPSSSPSSSTSSSPSSSASSSVPSSSDPSSDTPSSGSWRSSASYGSGDCSSCENNSVEVVTEISCDYGELHVTKKKIEAAECCDSGSGEGDDLGTFDNPIPI